MLPPLTGHPASVGRRATRAGPAATAQDRFRHVRALGSIIASASLIGAFGVAQAADNRTAGGVVLLAGGAAATWHWWRVAGPKAAVANATIFAAAFVLSHPLAKQIGAWPSVVTVTAVTAGATYLIASPKPQPIEA